MLDVMYFFLDILNNFCEKEQMNLNTDAFTDWSLLEKEVQRLNHQVLGNSVGIIAGQGVNFSQLGVLGHFAQSCPTIREANRMGAQLLSLNNDYVKVSMIEETDLTYCIYEPKHNFQEQYPNLTDEMIKGMMANIYTNNERLAGCLVPVTQVQFMGDAPEDSYWYQKVFRKQPDFNQDRYCITLPTEWLDKATISYNEELYKVLYAHIEQHYKVPKQLFSHKVKQFVLNELELMRGITLEDVAKQMLMSVRNVQRKLKEEDLTFVQLYEQCLYDLAVLWLQKDDISISDIAYRLNYASNATFTRAFKRWEGISPQQYRLSHKS